MWFRPFVAFVLLGSFALGDNDDDGLPSPGEPALQYSDGEFSEPRGSQSTYRLGATMNVSWDTSYETSNLWLISGYDFNSPIQLASNIGQTWYEWKVSTDSTNSSEIYTFRVVNATGTTAQQQVGGFLSAAFWIGGLPTSSISSTSTASHISTSAAAPVTTSGSITTSSATVQTPENTAELESPGLTTGAKTGIGVGVGVGGVGIVALVAGILFYRRSKNRKMQTGDNMEPYSPTPQTYVGTAGAHPYNEHYKPSEMEGAGTGVELDAGQGHRFIPEAYDRNGRSHPAELQG
ncbi:hypothetical protein M426DRAFT_14718 [Hypoxylon sp. CI-4A]|nr:hypothetical protein M426DRAFT_14718 [Hypoxylon sp. CI-4A]